MFSTRLNLFEFNNPASLDPGPVSLSVDVRLQQRMLSLVFQVTGDTSSIVWPETVPKPERADELWRHTCFEAFVQAAPSPAYLEFNFSPDSRWNCYTFDSYREGMARANPAPTCGLLQQVSSDRTRQFECRIDLDSWLTQHRDPLVRLGITSVIEFTDGHIEYWAIKHRADKPDFHAPDTFVCELPAP